MFDARTAQDLLPSQLPHAAARCLIACSCSDHITAERLRARSSRENSRAHTLRAAQLRRQAAVCEATARALAAEAR